MSTLIPSVPVEDIEPGSERLVIAALVEQLPQECKVYHNFEYGSNAGKSAKASKRCVSESEIDAVVLWPEKGLLVLEINGGDISFSSDRARWVSKNQNGEADIQDPVAQVRKKLLELIRVMENELNTDLKRVLTSGYAIVFPTSRIEGSLPQSADSAIVCDSSCLNRIEPFVDGALNSWRRGKKSTEKIPVSVEQLHKALLPAFNLVPSLKFRVDSESEQLLRLTQDQRAFLTFAENLSRVRIDGVAGSGKTLLAVEQVKRFAGSGLRVLFLCYNKSLAAWIRKSLDDAEASDLIEVRTFHDFCAQACKLAGIEFSPDNSDTF